MQIYANICADILNKCKYKIFCANNHVIMLSSWVVVKSTGSECLFWFEELQFRMGMGQQLGTSIPSLSELGLSENGGTHMKKPAIWAGKHWIFGKPLDFGVLDFQTYHDSHHDIFRHEHGHELDPHGPVSTPGWFEFLGQLLGIKAAWALFWEIFQAENDANIGYTIRVEWGWTKPTLLNLDFEGWTSTYHHLPTILVFTEGTLVLTHCQYPPNMGEKLDSGSWTFLFDSKSRP